MPKTLTLDVSDGNPTDGSVLIAASNHPHHSVDAGVIVTWSVPASDKSIDSITAITIKSGSDAIWIAKPAIVRSDKSKKTWTGTIAPDAKGHQLCVYSITWYAKGTPHVFDPIISIKPSPDLSSIMIAIVMAAVALVQTFRLRSFKLQSKEGK
jgi:hypothetical protein